MSFQRCRYRVSVKNAKGRRGECVQVQDSATVPLAAIRCCNWDGSCLGSVCTTDRPFSGAPLAMRPVTPITGFGNDVSLIEAGTECHTQNYPAGARLCTASELSTRVCKGTGCNYDKEFVWSSTSCRRLNRRPIHS